MKEIIGLTGQTGAGKSTAGKVFESLGYIVIDADTLAHEIYDNDLDCLVSIVEHFSCLVLNDKGKLNRKALGRIVFSNPAELMNLNNIIFPYLRSELEKRTSELLDKSENGIVIDGATLIESGCSKICTTLVSVVADENTRMKRIVERDAISTVEARKRISAQHDESFYTESSDYIIKNDGGAADMDSEIRYIAAKLSEKNKNEYFAGIMA